MNNSWNPRFLENSVTQTENFFMQNLRHQEPWKILTEARDLLCCHLLVAVWWPFWLCGWSYLLLPISWCHRSGRGHMLYWKKGEVFNISIWWAWGWSKGQGSQPATPFHRGASDSNPKESKKFPQFWEGRCTQANFSVSENVVTELLGGGDSRCYIRVQVWKQSCSSASVFTKICCSNRDYAKVSGLQPQSFLSHISCPF